MSDTMYLGGWRSGYADALDELYKVVEDDPDLDKRRLVLDLIAQVRARRDAAEAGYEARLGNDS